MRLRFGILLQKALSKGNRIIPSEIQEESTGALTELNTHQRPERTRQTIHVKLQRQRKRKYCHAYGSPDTPVGNQVRKIDFPNEPFWPFAFYTPQREISPDPKVENRIRRSNHQGRPNKLIDRSFLRKRKNIW